MSRIWKGATVYGGSHPGNGYRVACDAGMCGLPAFGAGQQSAGDDFDDDISIIGLWQFAFSSVGNNVPPFNIPDKAPLDAGYAQRRSSWIGRPEPPRVG